ncbi:hypothetical protein HDU91_002556 [Kappamyces sp. JEL0680]|nr:hypothetical protein HDU91_002556 [Kappamyces sp. JEL0680]
MNDNEQLTSSARQQIHSLRQQTKVLIKNLWDAAQDKETFESVLGPVKGRPATPDDDSLKVSTTKAAPRKYKEKLARSKAEAGMDKFKVVATIKRPKSRTTDPLLLPSQPDKDLLQRDDEYFKDLQEFRKLYQDKFMAVEEWTPRPKSPVDGYEQYKRSVNPLSGSLSRTQKRQLAGKMAQTAVLENDREPSTPFLANLHHYDHGYFRVNKDLTITKHEHPFKTIDDALMLDDEGASRMGENEPPCKVSLPIDTCMLLDKKYRHVLTLDTFPEPAGPTETPTTRSTLRM